MLGKSNTTVYSHELPDYRKNICCAALRKCGEKGRRRCIQEPWVWAVPSSIMNTPSRMGSYGSCRDTSFSFEVNSKGPAQNTRSEACTGVGVSLLFCAQWDCRWGATCVGVRCVQGCGSLTVAKPQSALKWWRDASKLVHVCTERLWSVLHTSKL